MAKNKINEATNVASSRSRSQLEKDNSKLKAFDSPLAIEANKTHLILKLLSPGTVIVLL